MTCGTYPFRCEPAYHGRLGRFAVVSGKGAGQWLCQRWSNLAGGGFRGSLLSVAPRLPKGPCRLTSPLWPRPGHTEKRRSLLSERVSVNPGGEPERNDTGLPPVDIEIPDDARELDRDVQAYRRELRATRRSERRGRWHRSLGKDGVALPLLACCLILALITGTLLTVFTATSSNLPGGSG